MSSAAKNSLPSSATHWLILIAPFVLLIPFAFPLLAFPDATPYPSGWLKNAARALYLTAIFFGPLVLLVPLIAILSIAVVFESMRDWFAADRTGASLGIAVLWMGPALLYAGLFGKVIYEIVTLF